MKDRKVYSPSYGWLSIMAAKTVSKIGPKKTIGAGLNTCVCTEPWIPYIDARPPRPSDLTFRHPKLFVHSFIRRDTKDFDTNFLFQYFHPENIMLNLKLRPSNTWSMDGYAWKSDTYSINSRYNVCDLEVQVVQPNINSLQPCVEYSCS